MSESNAPDDELGLFQDSEEMSKAFEALAHQEHLTSSQPHKLQVKHVVGLILVVALMPVALLWVFQYVG